jgi:hypothetical protein
VVHAFCTHWPPGQPPHERFALPHALETEPQSAPPSAAMHSGGAAPQTPPEHVCPEAHEHVRVLPQPSVTTPHKCVCESGVQVRAPHWPPSVAVGGAACTHRLAMQSWPLGQPPHAMGTPQPSRPTTPHWFPHAFGAHFWEVGSFGSRTQMLPERQGLPHAMIRPEQGSVYRPQAKPEGHTVTGAHASRCGMVGSGIGPRTCPSFGS